MDDNADGKNISYRDKAEKDRQDRIARLENLLSDGNAEMPDSITGKSESAALARSENPNRTENNKSDKHKKDNSGDGSNIHKGHRKRMRESARRDPEFASFSDVQLLEYLLSFATPQRDTNPIAHALLDKFGSPLAVFRAPAEELVKVKGVTKAAAEIISMLVKICVWDGKRDIRLSSTISAASFFGSMFLTGEKRGVCIAYLDTGFELIAAERFDSSSLELKPIVGAACRNNARYVLMSMRHDAFPDMHGISESVDALHNALSLVGIKLLDCLMFTDYGYYSNSAVGGGNEFVFYPYRMFVGSSEFVSLSIDDGDGEPVTTEIDFSAFIHGIDREFAYAEVAADSDE